MILQAAALVASVALQAPSGPRALPSTPMTSAAALSRDPRQERQTNGEKTPRRFREILQDVQYDGDYSPSASREPEAQPTPTTPVRFLPAWKRQIPVRVAPAPRYVDPQSAQDQNRPTTTNGSGQQAGQQFVTTTRTPSSADYVTSGNAQTPIAGGSATGSTTTADYGQALPDVGQTTTTTTTTAPAPR